jgi:hypothetical protein
MHVEGGMGIHPLQHIDEVDVGIDIRQATRREETLKRLCHKVDTNSMLYIISSIFYGYTFQYLG